MPTIKGQITATTGNGLQGVKFAVQNRPALLTLCASVQTAGDTIGFTIGSAEVLNSARPNVEAAAGVVDAQRDVILSGERVPPGEYYLPAVIGTATHRLNYLLIIDPVG